MTGYRLFGLVVDCAFPLRCLPVIAEPDHIDVHITIEQTQRPTTPYTPRMTLTWATNTGPILSHPAVGEFVYESPSLLRIHPAPGVEIAMIEPYVLGIGTAVLLTLQGYLVLHASAVTDQGRCFAFSGESGAGKSTLTTDQIQNGAAFISDDLAVVSRVKDDLMVWRGPPCLRLDVEMLEHFNINPDTLPTVLAKPNKRYWSPPHQIDAPYVPLTDIYLIQTDSTVALQPITGKQSLMRLLPQLYLAPYLKHIPPQQYQLLATVTQNIQLWALTYPRDLTYLPNIRRAIKTTTNSTLS